MDERNGEAGGTADRSTPKAPNQDEAALIARYSELLEAFFRAVSAALEELCQDVQGLDVSMKKNPGELLAMLPAFLHLQQISILEVQYALLGASKRPGIRFWFEGPAAHKRLRAVLFEDTRIWEVSFSLQKLYKELGTFVLGDGEIVAHAAPQLSGKPGARSHWEALLRAVLRAPVPGATAEGKAKDV